MVGGWVAGHDTTGHSVHVVGGWVAGHGGHSLHVGSGQVLTLEGTVNIIILFLQWKTL